MENADLGTLEPRSRYARAWAPSAVFMLLVVGAVIVLFCGPGFHNMWEITRMGVDGAQLIVVLGVLITWNWRFEGEAALDKSDARFIGPFTHHWKTLWSVWFLFYAIHTVREALEVHLGLLPEHSPQWDYGTNVVTNLLQIVQSATLFVLFWMTFKPAFYVRDNELRLKKWDEPVFIVCFSFAIAQGLLTLPFRGFPPHYAFIVNLSAGLLAGVASAMCMGLFIGRLQSRRFDVHHVEIVALAAYAGIQPFFPLLRVLQPVHLTGDALAFVPEWVPVLFELLLRAFACAFKLGLYRVVRRQIKTGRLASYLRERCELGSDAQEDGKADPREPVEAGGEAQEQPEALAKRVTVGIVTALGEERAAMLAMFDRTYPWSFPGPGAGRVYDLGELRAPGGGRCVVAIALAGMGNNVAAHRGTRLLEHFPGVEAILMTGIAGGVPSPHNADDHVRLGDVVVSDHRGVIQYDFVKQTQEITEVRASPRPPYARLLEAVSLLQSDALAGKKPWERYVERAGRRLNVARPEADRDLLLVSHEPRVEGNHPEDAKRTAGQPRIFMGPVASGNVLLKDPAWRDRLRDVHKVKAVEMETSGIADATWQCGVGYLAVRGICDYCDSTKNDEWHMYAAIVAAAYARAVIERMVGGDEEKGEPPKSASGRAGR